jgi:uncharacterized phage-like protein YoqJ
MHVYHKKHQHMSYTKYQCRLQIHERIDEGINFEFMDGSTAVSSEIYRYLKMTTIVLNI